MIWARSVAQVWSVLSPHPPKELLATTSHVPGGLEGGADPRRAVLHDAVTEDPGPEGIGGLSTRAGRERDAKGVRTRAGRRRQRHRAVDGLHGRDGGDEHHTHDADDGDRDEGAAPPRAPVGAAQGLLDERSS